MACCDHRINVDDLRDAANDPALEDCCRCGFASTNIHAAVPAAVPTIIRVRRTCRRDLLQQAKSARIAFQLRQHDRTTERTDVAQRVLDTDAAPADPYDMCCERHGTDACCQTSGGSGGRPARCGAQCHSACSRRAPAQCWYIVPVAELHQLREQRMRQLRHAAAQQRDAAALQYGVLHQVPETDALVRLALMSFGARPLLEACAMHAADATCAAPVLGPAKAHIASCRRW